MTITLGHAASGLLLFLCHTRGLMAHVGRSHAALSAGALATSLARALPFSPGSWEQRHTRCLFPLLCSQASRSLSHQGKSVSAQNTLFIQQILIEHPLYVRPLSTCQGCNSEQSEVPRPNPGCLPSSGGTDNKQRYLYHQQ